MGIIKNLFGDRSVAGNKSAINWTILESMTDVEEMIDQSERNTVIVFKHSNRCGISGSVLRKFEKKIGTSVTDQKLFYFLNVIKHRDVSSEIARRFNVRHESPQLIIIKNKEVTAHDSHYEILNMDLPAY